MQRGHIRKNGRWWVLKVRESVKVNGVETRIDTYKKLALISEHRAQTSGTPPPSVRALADLEVAKVNTGVGQGQSADSFKTYIERFLERGTGRNGRPLEASTLANYRQSYAAVKGFIPDVQMRRVRTPDINKIFQRLIEGDGDGSRATTSYRNIRNFLSGVCRAAVGEGAMDFNPVRDAMVLTGNDSNTHAYALQEIRMLHDTVTDYTARAAFITMAFTGLRKSELMGLRWEDYDRDQQMLNVQRSISLGKVKETKTKFSKAALPVVGIVEKALNEHFKKNTGDGYVFHAEKDSQSPINIEHLVFDIVKPELEKAGIQWHGLHGFRRGLDTELKDLGVDHSTRTDIMRHSPRNVTDRHYGRASQSQMRMALEKVEAEYKKIGTAVKKAKKRR